MCRLYVTNAEDVWNAFKLICNERYLSKRMTKGFLWVIQYVWRVKTHFTQFKSNFDGHHCNKCPAFYMIKLTIDASKFLGYITHILCKEFLSVNDFLSYEPKSIICFLKVLLERFHQIGVFKQEWKLTLRRENRFSCDRHHTFSGSHAKVFELSLSNENFAWHAKLYMVNVV